MALTGSESAAGFARLSLGGMIARVRTWLVDDSEHSLAQRTASAAFLIRVVSAALAFGSQVLLARWLGSSEFGIFVYVWTWVLVITALVDLGLASSAQRFVPEYIERKDFDHLRGYLSGARWLSFCVGCVFGVAGGLGVFLLQSWIDPKAVLPLYIACTTLPLYGLMLPQDGIARSLNWVGLALLPPFVIRQGLIVVLTGIAYFSGIGADAITAIVAACLSMWIATIGQTFVLNRRLKKTVAPGARRFAFRTWMSVSLPMLLIDCFYQFLMYADVLILGQFRSPHEVAVYYAVVKTISIVGFVYFAIGTASSHNFAKHHVAGDSERLSAAVADAIRWTFWPTIAATALILAAGWPLLWLFGPEFTEGYKLMFILALGTVARAAMGPGERLLNMLGAQTACIAVVVNAFAVNIFLCFLLIPPFGATGAAVATASAFVVEAILLFFAIRSRVGGVFLWSRAQSG